MSRLREMYQKDVRPALMDEFKYKSVMQIPKVDKIILNVGAGDAKENPKVIDNVIDELTLITGQKAVPTVAKKSVANFKIRAGQKIGAKVTLRGERMYEFMDRLFSLALPRVRDFKGINPDAFDGRGNYNLGLTEQLVFPELNPDKFVRPQGLNITMVTNVPSDEEARLLLKLFGMPYKTDNKK